MEIPPRPNMFCTSLVLCQKAWDATCLDAFIRCPRYYQRSILEGYRSGSDAMQFGLHYHAAVEQLDHALIDGLSVAEALDRAMVFFLEDTVTRDAKGKMTGQWETLDNRRTRWTGLRALIWYADEFGEGAVQPYQFPDGTHAVELSFSVPLPLDNPDGDPYILCGHMDGLTEFGQELYVRERKTTTATLSKYYFKRYSPNTQISVYDLIGNILFEKFNIRGVMVEATQTGVTFTRFQRHLVPRPDETREEFLHDILHWVKQAEACARDGYWPMNQAACSLYGGCPYRDTCSKAPSMRKRFLDAEFKQDFWDPTVER